MADIQDQTIEQRRFLREREARKIAELQLENRSRELFDAQRKLEQHYSTTVEVFSSLMSGRSGRSRASLRQLAKRAEKLGRALQLEPSELKDLRLAAMLCDIGKLTLSDELLATPVFEMSKDQFALFSQHSRFAYEALLALEPLNAVAQIVRDHTELFNGKGYPKGKSWDEISTAAQVLCIVKDHDAMRQGILTPNTETEAGAREFLLSNGGIRYAADMVNVFVELLESIDENPMEVGEKALHPAALEEGMILTRDLTSLDGVLMLGAGQVLTKQLIAKLFELEISANKEFVLYVVPADAGLDG